MQIGGGESCTRNGLHFETQACLDSIGGLMIASEADDNRCQGWAGIDRGGHAGSDHGSDSLLHDRWGVPKSKQSRGRIQRVILLLPSWIRTAAAAGWNLAHQQG